MVSSVPPGLPLTDETGRDLARAVSRLSYAVEAYNRARGDKKSGPPYGPTLLYTDDAYPAPPELPRRLTWHERVREKKVSVPAATGWSLLALALTEFLRLLLSGQIHLQ